MGRLLPGLLLVFALWPAGLSAEEKPAAPPTPGQAAEAVLVAFKAGDAAGLAALAARVEPDPWLVAAELCFGGKYDAAEAFSKAASEKIVGSLVTYVATRRKKPPDEEGHKLLVALREAFGKRDVAAALRLGSEVPQPLESVERIEVAYAYGIILRGRRKLQESAEALQRVAEAAQAVGWRRKLADAHHNRGVSLYFAADLAGALAAWEQEVTLVRGMGDMARVLETVGNIGAIYHRRGDYAQALLRYEEALAAMSELGHRRMMADTLANIGRVHRALGEPERALARYEQALAVATELGSPKQVASARGSIGNIRADLGRYEAALESLEFALRFHEGASDLREVAGALTNIANVHLQLGRHGDALAGYERAIGLYERLRDESGVARAVTNLGVVYKRLGDDERALASFRRALEIEERLGLEPGIASSLNNLAVVYKRMGEWKKALGHLERALEINRKLGRKRRVVYQLLNRAAVLAQMGRHEQALKDYAEVLAEAEALQDQAVVAAAHLNVSDAYLGRQDMEKALTARQKALAVLDKAPSPDTRAHVLRGIAEIHLYRKAYVEAMRSAREGIATVNRLAAGLAEGEGAGGRDLFWRIFGTGVLASVALKDADSATWFFEQSRAYSLRESIGSRSAMEHVVLPSVLREALDAGRREELRALAAYRAAIEQGNLAATAAARKAWEEARTAGRRLMARIQRESKRAAAVVLPEPDDLKTIQSHLQPGDVLLLYALTQSNGVALLIDSKGARMTVLAPSELIEQAIEAAQFDDPEVQETGVDRLRELLAAPLMLGGDTRRILVSPEGRLAYAPLALVFPGQEVAFIPSGTTYGLLKSEAAALGEKILALGDPDYQTKAGEAALRMRAGSARRLAALPATKKEVEAIADVHLLGGQASETGLQSAVEARERWRAVHFACHGLLDPERPMLSALALTADEENDGFLTAQEVFRMKIPADLVVLSACETGKGKIYRTEGVLGLTRGFMFAGAPRVICSLWKVDDEATRALMIKFYELWNPRAKLGDPVRPKGGPPGASGGSEGAAPSRLGAAAALKRAQEFIRTHPEHPEWSHPYFWAAWVLWGVPD